MIINYNHKTFIVQATSLIIAHKAGSHLGGASVCIDMLVIPECKQIMMSLRRQDIWAKMTSLRGKLTAPACHPTKFVNKAE